MQWSKLKARIEAHLCPELRGRVTFHVTSYRHSHDGAEKLWINVDGETVAQFGHYARQFAEAEELQSDASTMSTLRQRLDDRHEYGPEGAGDALRDYLDLSIDESLVSTHGLIRALAVADRRLGKRRLAQLDVREEPFPLVRLFYELRRDTDRG